MEKTENIIKNKENNAETSNKVSRKWDFTPLTDKEIANLANDMYRGLIFTDRHVQRHEDVPSVFMPLILLKEEDIEKLKANPPGMIYEYLDQAGPRAINGMPVFWSFRMIGTEDATKVMERYKKIKQAVEDVNKST